MDASRKRMFWQFSVREMLLILTAIAAILAVFVNNRPYSPTAFITTFDEQALLTKVCADLGLPIEFGGTSPGIFRPTTNYGEWESSLLVNLPDITTFRARVMPEFRNRVESILKKAGASIEGHSVGGNVQEFDYRYRIGRIRGRFRLYSLQYSENQLRLLILIDEW